MANGIGPGVVVKLKSGGPNMTVEWTRDEMAMCSWFDDKNEHNSKPFKLAALEVVT